MSVKPPLTPESLWHCVQEPAELTRVAEWFRSVHGVNLLDDAGRLHVQMRRGQGRRFFRSPVDGLAVEKCGGGLYAIYESRERYEQRRVQEDWTRFLSGKWTTEPPRWPGLYLVKCKEGFQDAHRVELLPGGAVRDADSGYVPPGQVTTWRGEWWSVPVPALRGAKP